MFLAHLNSQINQFKIMVDKLRIPDVRDELLMANRIVKVRIGSLKQKQRLAVVLEGFLAHGSSQFLAATAGSRMCNLGNKQKKL